jgi:hypothetical protein
MDGPRALGEYVPKGILESVGSRGVALQPSRLRRRAFQAADSLFERREHLIQGRDYFGDFRAENGSVISVLDRNRGIGSPPEIDVL